jgi:hypothetical protein
MLGRTWRTILVPVTVVHSVAQSLLCVLCLGTAPRGQVMRQSSIELLEAWRG